MIRFSFHHVVTLKPIDCLYTPPIIVNFQIWFFWQNFLSNIYTRNLHVTSEYQITRRHQLSPVMHMIFSSLSHEILKNCHFFPIVSSAVLCLPSHECPGYYKSHAHMSSASMVSCLLSECYLVLSVPIIFKLALDCFQKSQCYSWKLGWRLSSLLEQGVGAVLGLAREGVGIGAQGVCVCLCQFSAWMGGILCDEQNVKHWHVEGGKLLS